MNSLNIQFSRLVVHAVLWVLFIVMPVITIAPTVISLSNEAAGRFYFMFIYSSIALVIIFYLNYLVFIPKFYFQKKRILYAITVIVSLLVTILVTRTILHAIVVDVIQHVRNPASFIAFSTFRILLILFVSGALAVYERWRKVEKEKHAAEVSFLKSQINPHFLFNTLNSIYSQTLGKADTASEMLLKLSSLMHYNISEAHHEFVPLTKELLYIDNYIKLQKVRLSKRVKLEYHNSITETGLVISPFLLIPFIENTFKYGINSQQDSHIVIKVQLKRNELYLQAFNNKVVIDELRDDKVGLGISNTRQRLNLLYPSKHLLTITETEKDFSVSLHIKLT